MTKSSLRGLLLPIVWSCVLAGCGEHAHDTHRAHETHHAGHAAPATPDEPVAANPVQREMRLLVSALEGTVRGIGQGDVREVEHALHRVHEARATTEAAIHDGRYVPPRHPEQVGRFVELDEAFHRDLERLVDASHRNDVDASAEALGVVVRACPRCHGEFR